MAGGDDPVVDNGERPVPISDVSAPACRPLAFPPGRVTPAELAVSIIPSTMTIEEDSTLTANPSLLISDDGNVGGGVVKSGIVLEPMSKIPDGWRLMTVPSRLAAGPPTETIVPAMAKAEGSGVNVWPAIV